MIRSSVLRYGVRREEEIGARLSNEDNMNSTDLVGNYPMGMPAMHFCRVVTQVLPSSLTPGQKKAPLEGRAGPIGGGRTRQEGTQRSKGGGEASAVMSGI